MVRSKILSLSPSQLYDSTECPNCFWNQRAYTGVRKPGSPFPQITNGIDRSMRAMFDKHRKAGTVPPCVSALGSSIKICANASLVSNKMLNMPDSLEDNGVKFRGKLDELLEGPNGLIVIDFKTKGSAKGQDFVGNHTQVVAYAYLLEKNGYKVADIGYLMLVWPEITEDGLEISFGYKWVEVDTSAKARKAVRKLYENGAKLIFGSEPSRDPDCTWCNWKA